jgi:hypothetical protein
LIRPSDWNSDHVADGFLLAINRMTLASTSTLTLSQQTELAVTDNISGVDHVIVGVPRSPRVNQLVPSGYYHDVVSRLTLGGLQRMSVLGTGQLIMSDDFNARSRIVLAGKG